MATILNVSIDLNKIDKNKIKPHANGAKYYNLQVFINDTADSYGNNVSVCNAQSKEEREAKEKKTYIGNGKIIWSSESRPAEPKQEQPQQANEPANHKDDLPF